MRVLQVLPSIKSISGGPPRSTLVNCRALHAVDPDVETVLLSTDEQLNPGWREELLSRCPEHMTVEVLPGRGRHTTRFSFSLLGWMWQHIDDFDLLVIRALLHPISSAAARAARTKGVPYLLVPHGTLSRYTFSHRRTFLKRLYYRWVEAGTVNEASAIRFTARAERDEALRLGFNTPGAVIPHPYEPQFDRWSAEDSVPNQLLFLARFAPKKGIDLLLSAMPIVQREKPETKLVLAGAGSDRYESKLRTRIRSLGLERSVELPGFVGGDEKRRLLRESSVFILPSEQENFGVSVVEAMDAGLPVVITKGVDIWPEISDARAGIVLEKRTSEAVAAAILKLLSDGHHQNGMGRRGRELVRAAFNPEKVGHEVSHLYRAAVKGPEYVREEFS